MKWFWLSFFAFLAVLVGSAAFTRPDTVDSTLDFVGRFLTVVAWVVLALVVTGALLGGGLWVWSSVRARQERALREVDGRFPLQKYKLQDGRVLIYDPSLAIAAGTVIDTRTGTITEQEPAAGWHIQATIRALVERTSGIQAAFQGDASRSSKYGSLSRSGSAAGAARLIDAPRKPLALPAPAPVAPPIPAVVREWTPVEAMNQNTRTKFTVGQAGGNLVKWDLMETPHLRFHGMTQNGKTNAIKTVAAGAVRTGAHVIVLDRRRFKDWREFKDCAELVDTKDPKAFGDAVLKLRDIYQERDVLLGQQGAANIAELDSPPQRIVVVVSEFGALCATAADEGMLDEILYPLRLIMSEAGATGVHMLIEDQVVDKRWPRGIVANAAPVTGKLPENYGGAGGYYMAHTLAPYTFHYAGQTFRTFDMRAALPVVLAGMPRAKRLVSGVVPSPVDGSSISLNTPISSQEQGTGNTPIGPDSGKWYDFILDYMATEQGRGLWLSPAVGVRDLARAMSTHDTGNEAAESVYVSLASRTAKAIRSDVRLPSGEKLGSDITVSA